MSSHRASYTLVHPQLYEKTYFEEVIKMCQSQIDAIDYLHEQTLKISNNETQTSEENNGMV